MTTIYVTHDQYRNHQMPGYNHPEHPGRIEAVWETLREANLPDRMNIVTPTPATDEMILQVHSPKYLEVFRSIQNHKALVRLDADTYALPESEHIARLAAGGAVAAVDSVCREEAHNGLAAVRPPGHHATPDRAMGFCLLNNIAIAARHAQKQYGIKKIMIVDFDVHHGNGTQDIFYHDEQVLFLSTHQYPFYPGTGGINETGSGAGVGTTINIPLSSGYGDMSYQEIQEQIIWPAARRFQPELILVSAGFDAHFVDPLAMMKLSLTGYTYLTRSLIQMAEELCGGKIVFVMEGGYDLQSIGHGIRNIAHALLGEDEISDPYGLYAEKEPDVRQIIEEVREVHHL